MMMRNNLVFDSFDDALKEYAKENKVPIILDEGLSFLINIIKVSKTKKILEIGSAIGYSAIEIVKNTDSYVDTIERNLDMYNEAKKNIALANLNDKINIYNVDALESFDLFKHKKYDLIFIDAAKAQYKKFFQEFEILLNDNGIIICDNMNFHNLVNGNLDDMSRSLRGLVRKLSEFEAWLLENDKYLSSIYDIGDGMSISIKKE